jgi:hypothetical protein
MKIYEGGAKDYKNKLWRCPTIKDDTEKQDDEVLIFLICQVIEYQEEREKIYKKDDTAEDQDFIFKKKELNHCKHKKI